MTPLTRKMGEVVSGARYHPGLPVPEAGGGHGLEPLADGVGIIVDGPEDTEDTKGVKDMEDVEREGHGGQGGRGGHGGQEEK